MKDRYRIMHVIGSLGLGGANEMLLKLLTAMDGSRFPACVVTLTGRAELDVEVEALGVEVHNLDLPRGRLPGWRTIRELGRFARQFAPDLIQGWVYHGNLAASLAGISAAGRPPVIWNIRQALYRVTDERPITQLAIRLGAAISGSAALIVNNSALSLRQHRAFGFRAPAVVIPNGFDCERFRPDPQARAAIRSELGLERGERVIGMVGRWDQAKDHACFLAAASLLQARRPDLVFVLVGPGIDADNRALRSLLDAQRPRPRVLLLGPRRDIPRVTAAFDVATLSSRSEGFPNVVGEAMACGVPVVATDVGDVAAMLAGQGIVVPPGAPDRLAAGWLRVLDLPREERTAMGEGGRARMLAQYSLPAIAARYADLYRNLARRATGAASIGEVGD